MIYRSRTPPGSHKMAPGAQDVKSRGFDTIYKLERCENSLTTNARAVLDCYCDDNCKCVRTTHTDCNKTNVC
jgi:hypothetical protein